MAEKKRMVNLELLRCVAMMMVVVLHFLGKGGLLTGGDRSLSEGAVALDVTGYTAWMLESLCIVAVNVYMLISGYFLCTGSFKLSRLLQLWLQLEVYSVGIGVMAAALGIVEETAVDTHYYLSLLFPVSMGHYWFMTAYVFLYLLLPFVGMAVRKMSKEQMKATVIILLAVFCILKSVVPFRLEQDMKGYDCIWYLCVFVIAAYVRRFGLPVIQKKWTCLCIYLAASLLAFAEVMVLHGINLKTGSLSWIVNVSMEYNHILPLLGALGLFGFFLNLSVSDRVSPVINIVAACTLGVYLLHENLGLRYSWQNWLGADKVSGVGSLLLWTVVAVVTVFVCGVLIELVRSRIFGLLHKMLKKIGCFKKMFEMIEKADGIFKEV